MRVMVILVLMLPFSSMANTCFGKFINPVTDICWRCLFPLTIGKANLAKGEMPDTENPANPLCMCKKGVMPKVGLAIGYWEPARVIEVVREPYCFPTLGGLSLGQAIKNYGSQSDLSRSFYHIHYFIYPLLYWLNVITDGICLEKGDIDIGYLSELDPTWNDPALAFILNPESALFNNPLAIASCSEDCIKASSGLPDDKLFWCAGCQGPMYPITGHVQHQVGGVQASLLLVQRLLYKQHKEGLLWQTAGTDTETLCFKKPQPLIKKSQYRTQMIYPEAETEVSRGGCMPLGRSSSTWEAEKEFPIKGEDFAYLIWRKRNCCAF